MPRRALLLFLLLGGVACPGGLRRPQTGQVLLAGAVTVGGVEGRGDPLEGASVVARRRDTGEVLASNQASATGGYRLDVPVEARTALAVTFSAAGHAPQVRALDVGRGTELTLGASLEPLEALECTDESCGGAGGELRWRAPPLGALAAARAFEVAVDAPVTAAPPGEAQRVLAVAFVSLAMAVDGGTSDAGLPGELRLRVALREWPSLADAVPGSGAVEVPAAAFDVARAAWVPLGPVPLFTESGLAVPEGALAAIRAQDFAGGVVAALPVVGSGFMAVLGGAPLGCVEGTLDADGQPGLGATVGLGVEVGSADEAGAFCVQAPLSPTPLPIQLQYAGLPYRAAALPAPTAPGRCGGACASAGKRVLRPEDLVSAAACSVRGAVVDTAGQPVSGAVVAGYDASLTSSSFTTLCGPTGARCRLATATDAQGRFSLVLPAQTEVTVRARTDVTTQGQRFGALRVAGCPSAEVTVRLDQGRELLGATLAWSGTALTWSPPRAAARVAVVDAQGAPKWELESAAGLVPPLAWGQVPAGAREVTAARGAPASGDGATVLLEGTGRDGVQYFGVAAGVRP